MKIYAISILLERLDSKKPERILLHRSRFRADHDFHAIDVASDLDLITPRCRKSFIRSLHQWFSERNAKPGDAPEDELGL